VHCQLKGGRFIAPQVTITPTSNEPLAATNELDDEEGDDLAEHDDPDYLAYLLHRHGGNTDAAITIYNAGKESPEYLDYRARQQGALKEPAYVSAPTSLSLSFCSGLLTLSASRDELSAWALSVYGQERFSKDDSLRERQYPYREGNTVHIAPFVYRDYLMRNYAETSVILFLQSDTKFASIKLRSEGRQKARPGQRGTQR
jgi:hypothetical protein